MERKIGYVAVWRAIAVLVSPWAFVSPTLADAIIGGDSGEVSQSGPLYWYSGTTVNFGITSGKIGTLTVDSGTQITTQLARIGYSAGSSGAVTLTGANTRWTSTGGAVPFTDGTSVFVGYSGTGSLQIQNGAQFATQTSYIGRYSGSAGSVSVSGSGAAWSNTGWLYVGYGGSGTLNVTDGGTVTTQTLFASPSSLSGNGTINTKGLIWDGNLVFDATHGPQQTVAFGTGGSINLDLTSAAGLGAGHVGSGTVLITGGRQLATGSGRVGLNAGSSGQMTVSGAGTKWTNGGSLTLGDYGSGSLDVSGGAQVSASYADLGYHSGSGSATVRDAGSSLTMSGDLRVGAQGIGVMRILNGGHVTNAQGSIGTYTGNGEVTVSGAGSLWTNNSTLKLGNTSRLMISDTGQVTASSLYVGPQSAVSLHVSGDNMLVLGTAGAAGSIDSYGQLNLYASAYLPAGVYRPITDVNGRTMSWTGLTTYNAYGGTWNDTAKTFTVGAAANAAAGATNTLASGERLLITDASSGSSIGASFGSGVAGKTFSASLLPAAELASIPLLPGESVLAGWDFTTNLAGSPVLLAMNVSPNAENVRVWHYTGGTWSLASPADLKVSDGSVAFTASSFSGYALTGAVPEPMTIGLAGVVTLCALTLRRRSR